MLRILGSSRRLCDSLTRREMLRAGGLGMLGAAGGILPGFAGSGDAWAAPQTAGRSSSSTFGRAKRVILLYLYGAAAQHETYDPKPGAPAEIRGKFRPIDTAIPGVQICEHLPRLAKLADRVTFVRSMSHPYNIHSAAYTMTGVEAVDIPMELNPHDTRHWPFFGSVLDYLASGNLANGRRKPADNAAGAWGGAGQTSGDVEKPSARSAPATLDVPRNVALPFLFSSRCPQFDRGGPYGGFLGQGYNPVWTEFEGKAARPSTQYNGNADERVDDPFVAITPEGRFVVAGANQSATDVTLDRLNRRRSLLAQLDDGVRRLDKTAAVQGQDRFQGIAYDLLTSPKLREALDIGREPAAQRERYGMTLFGQATLAGRRLLEAGAQVVTVIWDEYGPANSAWDTHFYHYERLQNDLLPGLDAALTALLTDLEERGMLDDTLVMCLTEHGRTPQLFDKPRGVGREHWSEVYSNLLAGGGIARGKVLGASDKQGAYVQDHPVSPKDVLCTMYHLMGVDPQQTIPDRLGRPLPLVSGGEVVSELLG